MNEDLKGIPPLYPQQKAGETIVAELLADPCPHCLANGSRVVDSRPYVSNPAWRRRRRLCDACGERWTTLEVPFKLVTDALIGVSNGPGIRSLVREVATARSALEQFERLLQGMIGEKALAELQDTAEPEEC